MDSLNPDTRLQEWVAETKEAVLQLCQSHYPSGELPSDPWFLATSQDSKMHTTLSDFLHRAESDCHKFSLYVSEHLGALSSEIDRCSLALGMAAVDFMTVHTEMKRLQRKPGSEPSSVTMVVTSSDLPFALLSRGEAFGQQARMPATVELDLEALTVRIPEENMQEQVSPKELLSKLKVEKLLTPGIALEMQLPLNSGLSCDYQLTFNLNSMDRATVLAEQLRVMDESAKQTREKKKQLGEECKAIMKALGIGRLGA